MAAEWVLTVSQLNEYVRVKLSGDPMLRRMQVEGELSGVKRAVSGHYYFTLKDEGARVQCAMFRQQAASLRFVPEDGMRVVVTASASLYVASGAYQLYVDAMRPQGAGELYQRFEALKRRLSEEGLFDEALKRPIPLLPRTLGVVTSRTGAVLRDIVRVSRRRNPHVNILLSPAQVQGEAAAGEIVAALERLNREGSADVILCGRGGGSIEDLWPFNEEIVARAIRASRIPVISCVGHETDFTIADFAADLRAPTPSAAAELAVPRVDELEEGVHSGRERADRALSGRLEAASLRLARLTGSFALAQPAQMLVGPRRHRMDLLLSRLEAASGRALEQRSHQLSLLAGKLSSLSPDSVLGRGYAVIEREGRALSSVAELSGRVDIRMRDGRKRAQILTNPEETP